MMPATQTAPAKSLRDALADVDRLQAAAAKWAETETRKSTELEDFEASSARRLVEEPDAAAELTEQAARLRAGLELTRRTRKTAEQQLLDAHRQVIITRAAELRGQAQSLRSDAAQRQTKTDAMVAELRKWENCIFEPKLDFGTSGVTGAGVRAVPQTQRMLNQATHFEGQAAELERFASASKPQEIAAKGGQIRAQASAAQAPAA